MSDEPRIQLADVKADIEKAFEGWISALDDDETEDPENLGDEAKDLNASHARITQFLKQAEADRAEIERLRGELAEMTARAERAQADWVEPVRVANAIVAEFKYPAEPPFREMLIEVVTIVERCAQERNRLRDKLRWVLTAEPEELDQWRHGEDAAAMVNDTDDERSTSGTL